MKKTQTGVPADGTHILSRRRLLAVSLAGAGAATTGARLLQGAAGSGGATEIVTLGRTGIKTTRLAQGTGFNGGARSSAQTRLGQKLFTKLIRHSLDRGIRLLDTADLYGAHPYLNRALKGIPRDNYSLLSKLWPRNEYWNMASGGAIEEVNRFRKELSSDVIDICLIHCMTNSNWTQEYQRIRDELSELKEQGAVRAVGVSCHDFGALKVACTHPWTDVVLARINNVGKEAFMDGTVAEVRQLLKQARANGKTVIGMKIFGAGRLTTPEKMDASMKFVLGNDLVDAITIGTLDSAQVDDTIERMNRALAA